MEIRSLAEERDAIVGILAPQLAVLHHEASSTDLNFVLLGGHWNGDPETSGDMAKRYTAEALCDLFQRHGIRLVISDDVDLDAIAAEVQAEKLKAAEPGEDGAPRFQPPNQSRKVKPGETIADVAPALVSNPERERTVDRNTPLGRLMASADPRTLQTARDRIAGASPRDKAERAVRVIAKQFLEKTGCSVIIADNGQDGTTEVTKMTLHIDLPGSQNSAAGLFRKDPK